jgi:hypothetical protein
MLARDWFGFTSEAAMHVIFDDPQFDQTLRLLGSAVTGDAEVGEMLSTAARITPGDFGSWTAQWPVKPTRPHSRRFRTSTVPSPSSLT